MSSLWEIVGGSETGGILVRSGKALSSAQAPDRLSTGATVEELSCIGDRLRFKRLTGTGPETGWISTSMKGKTLARRMAADRSSAPNGAMSMSTAFPSLVRVADGVFEHIVVQPSHHHDSCAGMIKRGLRSKELKLKATTIDSQVKAGDAVSQCCWRIRMVIAQLDSDGLLIYNPVECTPELQVAVSTLGEVRVVVLPNSQHAVHHASWRTAFPTAAIAMPGGPAMTPIREELPAESSASAPFVLRSGSAPSTEVATVLSGFRVEVVDTAGWEEVVLLHEKSGSLLTSDFMYYSKLDKADRDGWVQMSTEDWSLLYYEAYGKKPSNILLPLYRVGLDMKQRAVVAASLKNIISWKPSKMICAHAAKVADEGEGYCTALLHKAWGWCFSE